jgi:hypothetical protein
MIKSFISSIFRSFVETIVVHVWDNVEIYRGFLLYYFFSYNNFGKIYEKYLTGRVFGKYDCWYSCIMVKKIKL